MIIFHMVVEMMDVPFRSGLRSSTESCGGSVARARAASVSMIRFTHSSWTAVRTLASLGLDTAETNVRTTAVTLTVSWNCRKRLTASVTARPHLRALTMDV